MSCLCQNAQFEIPWYILWDPGFGRTSWGGGQCGPYLAQPPVRLLSAVSRVGTQSGVEGCHIRHPKAPSYHIPKLFLLASSRFIWIQHSTSTRSLCTKLYSFAERWYREIESCGLFLFCYQPPLKEESWEDLKMSEMLIQKLKCLWKSVGERELSEKIRWALPTETGAAENTIFDPCSSEYIHRGKNIFIWVRNREREREKRERKRERRRKRKREDFIKCI